MTLRWIAVSTAALTLALSGCGREDSAPSASAASAPVPAASSPTPSSSHASVSPSSPDPALAWLGQWNGPEGTYLKLEAAGPGRYEIRIKDLDAERTFQGTAKDGAVQFERDGKQESIRATDGDATGMKWLAGKATCLTVRAGEGYCRN